MTVKEILIADLQNTLEEAANLMTDRMVLRSLAKNGSITLEEADFFDGLTRRVVTEAAEEFVPDELITEGAEPMILTGEDGTVYSFNPATCELTPVENTGGAEDNPSVDDMGEGAALAQESTEVEGKELTESTEASEPQELTESQQIVSNLIKSLGA
jgi:hypothetical protein